MKKLKNKNQVTKRSRSPQERQRLVALWIFTTFLVMTVGLIVYGLWASFFG